MAMTKAVNDLFENVASCAFIKVLVLLHEVKQVPTVRVLHYHE